MQRFDRILGILLFLRSKRSVSAAALARQFAVSTRTIHRDLEILSTLGVPLYAERGRQGGVRLLPGYFLPPFMFTQQEAIALLLGLTLQRSLRATLAWIKDRKRCWPFYKFPVQDRDFSMTSIIIVEIWAV